MDFQSLRIKARYHADRAASPLPYLLLFLAVGICAACRMPPECNQFYELPHTERYAKFPTYPLDKQITIYLCAMNREPPDLRLAGLIAEEGDKVIPFLLEKARAQKSENAQDDIVYIFEVMAQRGGLRGRADVVEDLQKIVQSMKNESIRRRSQGRLAKIEADI